MLFLSGHLLRLFHFDASGVQYTSPLDIHAEPYTFVRLLLGMSSPDEADIGLDTSIRWVIEKGRKTSGTLTSWDQDNIEVVYPLLDVEPFFSRPVIRGRCTTCWRVSHPVSGEELLVKDSWKSDERTPEHVFLEMARDIPGVAQMVSYESDRGRTRDLRSFGIERPVNFQDRVETRVIVKLYGQAIDKFSSAKELLGLIRDTIEGTAQTTQLTLLFSSLSFCISSQAAFEERDPTSRHLAPPYFERETRSGTWSSGDPD